MDGQREVVVVIGTGGMGLAAIRRVGAGAIVVIADLDEDRLKRVSDSVRADGFDVREHVVDVSRRESVEALATDAAELGPVKILIHTAGLSPVQAPAASIMAVDLLGTALVLDAFGEVMAPGGAGVFIASMAGQMAQISPELEMKLASVPTGDLIDLPELSPDRLDGSAAYGIAKRGNQRRIQASSVKWGRRGARVNSISPGVISTAMGQAELAGPSGDAMRGMIAGSGSGRVGTPDDIAAAIAFLVGPDSTFITGTDLLVDGGVVASLGPQVS